MKLFSLKDYGESSTSAPQLIGDIATEYGRKQIHKLAEFNGLDATALATKYAMVVPFGVDHTTAASLHFIYDMLYSVGCETYTTQCGEVYAVKSGQNYSYLDNHVDDVMWDELSGYGEDSA